MALSRAQREILTEIMSWELTESRKKMLQKLILQVWKIETPDCNFVRFYRDPAICAYELCKDSDEEEVCRHKLFWYHKIVMSLGKKYMELGWEVKIIDDKFYYINSKNREIRLIQFYKM
tara:strand:- start:122 stop:478 length:357 start_codon:yes stop_codon:yes gene_type:complete